MGRIGANGQDGHLQVRIRKGLPLALPRTIEFTDKTPSQTITKTISPYLLVYFYHLLHLAPSYGAALCIWKWQDDDVGIPQDLQASSPNVFIHLFAHDTWNPAQCMCLQTHPNTNMFESLEVSSIFIQVYMCIHELQMRQTRVFEELVMIAEAS